MIDSEFYPDAEVPSPEVAITSLSRSSERVDLPVKGFLGEKDDARAPLEAQFQDARRLAASNGYRNVSSEILAGKGHDPLPDEVLAYFSTLLATAPEQGKKP